MAKSTVLVSGRILFRVRFATGLSWGFRFCSLGVLCLVPMDLRWSGLWLWVVQKRAIKTTKKLVSPATTNQPSSVLLCCCCCCCCTGKSSLCKTGAKQTQIACTRNGSRGLQNLKISTKFRRSTTRSFPVWWFPCSVRHQLDNK